MPVPLHVSSSHGPAWILGASSGLGYALAQQLLEEGWQVVVSARHYSGPLQDFTSRPSAHVMPLDITNRDTILHAADYIEREHGIPALVVVCAGQFQPEPDGLVKLDTLEALWDVNVRGTQHVLDGIRPKMLRAGRGQVVAVGSLVGYAPTTTSAAYGATKAALMHLVAGQHAAWWNDGLLLQLATPGFIDTPMIAHSRYPTPFCLSAKTAARRLLRAMKSSRFELTFPWPASLLARLSSWLPWSWRLRRFSQWLDRRNTHRRQHP